MSVSEEELKRVGNWVKIVICHDRYFFDTTMEVFMNKSLEDTIKEDWDYNSEIEKLERNKPHSSKDLSYIIDNCSHRIPNRYEMKEIFKENIDYFDIDVTYVIDFEQFLEEGSCAFVWGQTNNKFGVLDFRR